MGLCIVTSGLKVDLSYILGALENSGQVTTIPHPELRPSLVCSQQQRELRVTSLERAIICRGPSIRGPCFGGGSEPDILMKRDCIRDHGR